MAIYPNAEIHPSSNFGYPPGAHGRNGESVRLYVQHTTASDVDKLRHRNWFLLSDVAPHFCIFTDGTIDQYVDTEDAAWGCNPILKPDPHIALSGDNANLIAINIEWQGKPGVPLTRKQLAAGIKLHLWLNLTHPLFAIDRNHIIGHDQINSVDRANDPGPAFPWDRLLEGMKGDTMTDEQRAELRRIAVIFASWTKFLIARATVAEVQGYGITDTLSRRMAEELGGAVDSLVELAS
jgi:N-acetyl-anhydromuramyl-L-alanine amidase AmpD